LGVGERGARTGIRSDGEDVGDGLAGAAD